MKKRSEKLLVLSLSLILSFVFFNLVSAQEASISGNQVRIDTEGRMVYSYEVNLYAPSGVSISGNNNYLGGSNVATYGQSIKGAMVSVYGSRLDESATGVIKDDVAFNFVGTDIRLYSLLTVDNQAGESLKYYFNICGNGVVESGDFVGTETCDDGNSVGGDGCSALCQLESCGNGVVDVGEQCDAGSSNGPCPSLCANNSCMLNVCRVEDNKSSSSLGRGGGSVLVNGNLIKLKSINELSFNAIIGKSSNKTIEIKNEGNILVKLDLKIVGLRGANLSSYSLVLSPGETRSFDILFSDVKAGVNTGSIDVYVSGMKVKSILVMVSSKTENFLFDVKLNIPRPFKYILPGQKVLAEVDLKKVGADSTKTGMTLYYIVKSFTGNTIYEESEKLEIDREESYTKEIPTDSLPIGDYVLGLEAVYPGAFASSSVKFSVVDKKPFFYNVLPVLILFIMVVVAIILGYWAVRRRNLIYKNLNLDLNRRKRR